MSNNINLEQKFYYPSCRETGCDGLLKIKINNNFSIDYECGKNKNHNGKNIFFKTFERFYLKEQTIDKCSRCQLKLESNSKYKCKICQNIYCSSCFIYDEHIKNLISNLTIKNQKCSIHKMRLTQFCIDCNKYICIYCKKDNDEEISHKDHTIQNILDYMPSLNFIDNLKSKIKQKLKYNDINKFNK